ncbi:MAG: FtsK/SpoIIIE domain-containing protein [Treponema sp.]|nr:FtsK/SpoIIIE domain-containing protein [Treponema sp.]
MIAALPKDFFRLSVSKYRLWTAVCSGVFGLSGVFLTISVIAAFFNAGTFLSAPGAFFVRGYGFLALAIPAFFLYAAFILADPRYQPERIFFLASAIFPFFTLALGFYWIREYETLKLSSLFIARAGKAGIALLAFFLVSLEVLIIFLIRLLMFKRDAADLSKNAATSAVEGEPPLAETLPETASQKLNDIYTSSAAAMSTSEIHPNVPPTSKLAAKATDLPANSALPDYAYFDTETAEIDTSYMEEIGRIDDEDFGMLEDVGDIGNIEEMFSADGEDVADMHDDGETAYTDSREADEDVEKALAEAAALAAPKLSRSTAIDANSAQSSGGVNTVGKSTARKRRAPYFVPVDGLLKQYPDGEYWIIDDETRNAAVVLKDTFKEFNIQVEVTGIRKGPVITMFEILPAPGIKLTKIEGLADNIALRLAAQSVRIVAPIPGKHAVGIEVPNIRRNIVSFREIIESELARDGKVPEIPMVLGKDITGETVTVDLIQMPHLLIAGSTGSGKSVCVNSMILTILYQKSPAECRMILIDPKIVELKLYNDIPHLLTPVITEPKKAFQALQYCICEMERRYACLDSLGVRDIRSYNRRIKERSIATEHMPYIVVVIDEFADLMATTGKELESTVARLAAMSRAVGIHLVLATQRPSIDVITGLIKANIPSRIAFMVASKMDSRIIIDMVGAEKLLGKGDMLYAGAVDPFPVRMQGAFVSEEEIERVVDYVKSLGEPDYIDDEIFFDDEDDESDPLFDEGDDPLYEKALEIVTQQGKASASYIQRRLKIGYNRAARLVEIMEHRGVVGPAQGSRPRELLRGA